MKIKIGKKLSDNKSNILSGLLVIFFLFSIELNFKNSNYLANMDRAYSFLIFKTDDKTLLGGINIGNVRRGVSQSASLGYWIGEKHSRNGYMKEALKLLIPSLFVDLRLNRIEAATLEENIASKNLLKKIGFKKEGVLRKYLKINGTWRDHILYGLLENDFK